MKNTAARTRWVGMRMMIFVFLVTVFAGSAYATPFPGPDGAGYSGTEIASNLRDVSATGTALPLADDEVSGAIPIGFSFQFYGNSYSELYVSSNGFVRFGGAGPHSGCCSGQPIPTNDAINNMIAGLWTDINPFTGGTIRYQTLGSPGSRQFVVGFYATRFFSSTNVATFEIILHEGSNAIELQYGTVQAYDMFHTTSVGIEHASGAVGMQLFLGPSDDHTALSNRGFQISPPVTTSIPTLGHLGLLLLALLLGGVTWVNQRRHSDPL